MWRIRRIINFILYFGIIELFLIIFIFINVTTFLLYAISRYKVAKRKRRVNENILIFFTLTGGGIGAFLGLLLLRHKGKNSKLKTAVALGLIIAIIPAIHIVHSMTLDRIVRFVEIDFQSENWPTHLDGYRIAFMTDFHTITDEDMADIIKELNERNLDLLLLGGDFSSDVFWGGTHYQGTLREISQANTTDGIFGVEGNHDYYIKLFRAKEQYGITPLDNSGLQIREGFYLAGVQDKWLRNPNIGEAIAGAKTDDFILLISHHPDVMMKQSTNGIDLIFTGHTHGGQITFFGFPIYLLRGDVSAYGLRFAHGFAYSADNVPVFTTRGVGVYYSWPRVFSRPEVVIFTMYSE